MPGAFASWTTNILSFRLWTIRIFWCQNLTWCCGIERLNQYKPSFSSKCLGRSFTTCIPQLADDSGPTVLTLMSKLAIEKKRCACTDLAYRNHQRSYAMRCTASFLSIFVSASYTHGSLSGKTMYMCQCESARHPKKDVHVSLRISQTSQKTLNGTHCSRFECVTYFFASYIRLWIDRYIRRMYFVWAHPLKTSHDLMRISDRTHIHSRYSCHFVLFTPSRVYWLTWPYSKNEPCNSAIERVGITELAKTMSACKAWFPH